MDGCRNDSRSRETDLSFLKKKSSHLPPTEWRDWQVSLEKAIGHEMRATFQDAVSRLMQARPELPLKNSH